MGLCYSILSKGIDNVLNNYDKYCPGIAFKNVINFYWGKDENQITARLDNTSSIKWNCRGFLDV